MDSLCDIRPDCHHHFDANVTSNAMFTSDKSLGWDETYICKTSQCKILFLLHCCLPVFYGSPPHGHVMLTNHALKWDYTSLPDTHCKIKETLLFLHPPLMIMTEAKNLEKPGYFWKCKLLQLLSFLLFPEILLVSYLSCILDHFFSCFAKSCIKYLPLPRSYKTQHINSGFVFRYWTV